MGTCASCTRAEEHQERRGAKGGGIAAAPSALLAPTWAEAVTASRRKQAGKGTGQGGGRGLFVTAADVFADKHGHPYDNSGGRGSGGYPRPSFLSPSKEVRPYAPKTQKHLKASKIFKLYILFKLIITLHTSSLQTPLPNPNKP
jgi:hypothetical protein